MIKHILTINRINQVDVMLVTHHQPTDYFLFEITEHDGRCDKWKVTFETIEQIYEAAKNFRSERLKK